MRDFYFLFHRADEDDANTRPFSESAYKKGPAVLVNLDQAYGIEPLYDGMVRPVCITFGDTELLIWETVEEIDLALCDRRLQLVSEFGNRP